MNKTSFNKRKRLTTEDLELYYSLGERIEKEANDLLRWYDKNVHNVVNVDDLTFDYLANGKICYNGYVCQETIGTTLEAHLLFLSDKKRAEYAKKFKDDLAEKQRKKDKQWEIDLEKYERKELERLKKKYKL